MGSCRSEVSPPQNPDGKPRLGQDRGDRADEAFAPSGHPGTTAAVGSLTSQLGGMDSERVEPLSPRARAVALPTFFRIAELWGLSDDEQMALLGLQADLTTFNKWRDASRSTAPTDPDNGELPGNDVVVRISYIVGIFAALQTLLSDHEAADGWVKRPNLAPPFGGRSALDRMMSGRVEDLSLVRDYLDAVCGGRP